MLLALALMGQDMNLNADANRAVACGRAVTATRPASGDAAVGPTLHAVYFMMSAAQADPGTDPKKRFIERTTDIAPQVFRPGEQTAAQLTATLAACDKSFPLARSTAPVKLPANAFDRDMMCAATSSYAYGLLAGAGIADTVKDYQRVQEGFLKRIPDTVLAAHGITDEPGIIGAMDGALRNSLRIGNFGTIMQACTRELDGK